MKKYLLAIAACLIVPLAGVPLRAAGGPPVIPLWTGDAPGSAGQTGTEQVRLFEGEHIVSGIHHPSITVVLPAPEKNTGAGVVICPGGGHRELWMDHEGYNVARWLSAHGIAGFILKYRLAREEGSTYQIENHSLADLQRALRLVRSRAREWGVDPARVGVIGFSAGGELAALAGMRFGAPPPGATDPVDRLEDRPAFQALVYPGNPQSILPVRNAPPAFLVCGDDDRPGMPDGLAEAYVRFKHAGVPAELHIFTGVGHGFGIRANNHSPTGAWPERFREWLADRGFLKGPS